MSTKDSKDCREFLLEIVNIHASVRAAVNASMKVSGNKAFDEAWFAAGGVTRNHIRKILCEMRRREEIAVYCVEYAIRNNVQETVEEISKLVKTPQGLAGFACKYATTDEKDIKRAMAKIACKHAIIGRKDIEQTIRLKCWNDISSKVLSSEEKIDIIGKLMTYEKKKMEAFKKNLPVQLHNIFFRLERLIKVSAELSKEDERKLMTKHRKLTKEVAVASSYHNLFSSREVDVKISALPTVLSKIVIGYTKLSCFDDLDVDLIFGRMIPVDCSPQ